MTLANWFGFALVAGMLVAAIWFLPDFGPEDNEP